jgi:hypothetical protein
MKGLVRPAKTVKRRVAEMSIRNARRVSGLNPDPCIQPIMSHLTRSPMHPGNDA